MIFTLRASLYTITIQENIHEDLNQLYFLDFKVLQPNLKQYEAFHSKLEYFLKL
jgi:hypothetical protein